MYRQIEAEMVRCGISKRTVAEKMGIGYNTLLLKLKKQTPFSFDEALALKGILNSDMSVEKLFEFSDLKNNPPA